MLNSVGRQGLLPVIFLLLAGCAAGPVYQAPSSTDLGVPASWRGKPAESVTPDDLSRWWAKLGRGRWSGR